MCIETKPEVKENNNNPSTIEIKWRQESYMFN